jgi:tetratricopeptide (TPR) repeat protein
MGEVVADIEASLGEDFLRDAPAPAVAALPSIPTWPAVQAAPLAASAAAAAAGSAMARSAPAPQSLAAAPVVAPVSAISPLQPTAVKASPFAEDVGVDLSEMFGELKQDLEAGGDRNDEDPETHYNLGIAFREMGLLDEAIGELQKTCQTVDRGHPFPLLMQTYTWLAQCFIEKGVPEAAIRWYDKAMQFKGIDEETRIALYYEIAAAYESCGDRTAALKNFMEVYGRNIDYRDVAERIRALKS